ncbi:MAG: nucleotidyltransferase domain-containing protein [Candidatus Woesearchaeota archaeon]
MLTKTQLKILVYLIDHQDELLGIRELAKRISVVYYLVQKNVQRLKEKNIITLQKAGRTSIIRISSEVEPSYLLEAERFKKELFYQKYPHLKVISKKIIQQMASSFFVLLVFGSYASGNPRKDSDLDLLIITPKPKNAERTIRSIARTSTIDIHETIVTEKSFLSMLQKKELNVALEAEMNHILIYGTENFYKLTS